MFGRTRRLTEALADEKARNATLRQQLHDAEQERDSWKWAAKNTISSREDLTVVRTKERDQAVRELTAAEKVIVALRQRLANPGAELRDARREVLLLRGHTAQLTKRLEDLQKANEALYASGALAEVTQ